MDQKNRPKRRRCEDKSQPPKNSLTSDDTWFVTSDQLRELWCYDNECGRRLMKGCPLRTCSVDGKQTGGDCKDGLGLTVQEMVLVKLKILEMWKQAATLFEIFINKEEVEEGYRLRVRKDAPVKLAIKQQDALVFGWIAQIPTELSTAHVFNRSTVEPNGYLGGPISYMNWCSSNQQKVCIFPTLNNRSICKMYITGALPAGSELKWNYGRSFMPNNGDWFHTECCEQSTVDPVDQKRHGQNVISRAHCFKELCVLCGFPYSIDNKENRAQRKQHLAGVHADFLGSEWNGTGFYDQEEVDPDILFCAVDILNQFLGAIKRMNWNVLPACNLFSPEELEGFGDDEEALLDEFQRRKENFKVGGTLILRGSEIPSTAAHFQKIEPRQWKVLTWKNQVKPPAGRYAVSTEMKEANQSQLSSLINSFFEKYM